MIILLVGSGGREHAIARAIKNSPLTSKLFITPGNPGMQKLGECKNIPVDDIEGLCNLAKLIESCAFRNVVTEKGPENAE